MSSACSAQKGEAIAAAEALSVSEEALQRIKLHGCGTSKQDRRIMRMPDLKALSYPKATNMPVEIAPTTGNGYAERTIGHVAEQFAPPFAKTEPSNLQDISLTSNMSSGGSFGVPGEHFANSGDLRAIERNTFDAPDSIYMKIAESIKGGAVTPAFPSKHWNRSEDDSLQPASSIPNHELMKEPENRTAVSGDPFVYGAPEPSPLPQTPHFLQLCKTALLGALYDLLHAHESAREAGALTQSGGMDYLAMASHVLTRDGRGPFILFVFVLFVLVFVMISHLTGHSSGSLDCAVMRYVPVMHMKR